MHQAFSISILYEVVDYSSKARHCNAALCASEGAKLQLRRPLMTHIECNYINCICLGLFSFISVKSSINIFWNAALPKPFFFLLLDSEMFNNFQHIAKNNKNGVQFPHRATFSGYFFVLRWHTWTYKWDFGYKLQAICSIYLKNARATLYIWIYTKLMRLHCAIKKVLKWAKY